MEKKVLKIGHSPDPDDAFMFYGLAKGKVKIRDFEIEHVLADIQTLNERAFKRELEVTAVSAFAFTRMADDYWIMKTGASMGEGYGPILVAREPLKPEALKGKKVAIPGVWTTAYLLAQIYLPRFEPVPVDFAKVFETVKSGQAVAGVIIHEGQLTYPETGLHKIADFGQLWFAETALPLPLGLDVVRRDLGKKLAEEISCGLKQSIEYGFAHEPAALDYALQFGRGIGSATGRKFVRMYVNDYTLDMGQKGERALRRLFDKAAKKGFLKNKPEVELV
ncbi:MAG TPA: MqnA/MqnD/SBP family protein [candidate division Zixibacteria bacterium]|nr:MqnA/MqnD/SBP family protein [candidate division Zixibacteria bacterium]